MNGIYECVSLMRLALLHALLERSLVCRALLDNAAVGTDPVSRLSPFALARMAPAVAHGGHDWACWNVFVVF